MGANNGATEHGEIFDLDALERDSDDTFPFTAGGVTFHLANPEGLDWREQLRLADTDSNAVLLEVLLGDEYEAFKALDVAMPVWKIERLVEAAGAHFGISVPESVASPGSSNRTARRSKRTSGRTTASASRTSPRGG
jgi:hypothetical protein